jgi:hypothetical protein
VHRLLLLLLLLLALLLCGNLLMCRRVRIVMLTGQRTESMLQPMHLLSLLCFVFFLRRMHMLQGMRMHLSAVRFVRMMHMRMMRMCMLLLVSGVVWMLRVLQPTALLVQLRFVLRRQRRRGRRQGRRMK